jgi:hypothetical protein
VYIGIYINYPLLVSDFNKTLIFSAVFSKNGQIPNFMEICAVSAEMFHVNPQRDITKLVVALRNFANMSKGLSFTNSYKSNLSRGLPFKRIFTTDS